MIKSTSSKFRSSFNSDNISDIGSPHPHEPRDFLEINSCTSRDIYCCLIFTALTSFSILLSIYFLTLGDPERLTRGWDFRGEICGLGDLSSQPYTYFPDPTNSTSIRLCLPGCPATTTLKTVCFYDTDSLMMHDSKCYDSYPSKPYYNRHCLPSDEEGRDDVMESLDEAMIRLAWWAGDVGRVWDVLGAGTLISLGVVIVALVWISIGTFVKALAAVTNFILVGFTVILGYLLYKEGFRLEDDLCDDFDPVEMRDCDYDAATKAHIVLSSFIYLAALIMGLIYLLYHKVISRASFLVRNSWQPIARDKSLLIVPTILTVLSSGIAVLCLYSTVYGLSVASIEKVDVESVPGGKVKTLDFGRYEKILIVYMIANYVWAINFLSQICYYVSAFAEVLYVFNKEKSSCYLFSGLKHALSSLGTIALGSFFIPIAQFIKLVFPCYLLFKKQNIIRSISHSSYTMQIITGVNFFRSGIRARALLDSASPDTKKAILGARLLHWFTSILAIVIAPLFVAYWLTFQDKTPTDSEETKRVTSISVMCAAVIFPAWSIAKIWYMFLHGLSNSAAIVSLYRSEPQSIDLSDPKASSSKVSPSYTNDLEKQNSEPKHEKGEADVENLDATMNQTSFLPQGNLEGDAVALAGVIRPITQSGRKPRPLSPKHEQKEVQDTFRSRENVSSTSHIDSYRAHEEPKYSIDKQAAYPSEHMQHSKLRKQLSSDFPEAKFADSESKHLSRMRDELDEREAVLKSEVSALEGVQGGYKETDQGVYSNRRMMAGDPEELQRAKEVMDSLTAEGVLDMEGDYENPKPIRDVPQVMNPSSSKEDLKLLY
jgi:hypothetical protein